MAHLINLIYQLCYHMGSAPDHMTFGRGSPLGRGLGADWEQFPFLF